MTRTEYHGKRGANAGDDYHELWAVRRALQTLVPTSRVQEVTVEGVRASDEASHEDRVWDGVDCAVYLGATPEQIDSIEIAQLKYSGSAPGTSWSLARLLAASNKAKDNSVIARLATAYAAEASNYPELAEAGSIQVKLVSNQPIGDDVEIALGRGAEGVAPDAGLKKATGLDDKTFSGFARSLDFSECGSETRFAIEERVIATISEWSDEDANVQLSSLRTFIRNRMKPEGHRLSITKESILGVFGHADARSFFPAPSEIEPVQQLVERSTASKVRDLFLAGENRICLHGAGGEGKTTVLQDLAGKLPLGSIVIAYDCYGGGTYMHSDAYRHRERDAFTQLSNETSAKMMLPLLFSGSHETDHPRRFAHRVRRAAESLAATATDALLVIAIDAADNAVTAAKQLAHTPFTTAFMALGALPSNVRLMVSARTGRLPELQVPQAFKKVKLGAFNREETAQFVGRALKARSDEWLDDFHALSGGNPRVQRYALEFGAGDGERVLAYLKPNGKDLEGIFRSRLEEALRKGGDKAEIERLCAGLVVLPRPVPVAHLATITALEPAHVVDLALDLAPGLSLQRDAITFADEDFERFVEEVARPAVDDVRRLAAERLLAESAIDAYAAEHAAGLLLAACKGPELLALARVDPRTYPITDVAVRGEVHRARLQAAMRLCRATGSDAEAVSLLLLGADAIQTDAAVRQTLTDNTDLAVAFSRDRIVAEVLRDKDRRRDHGPLLMQMIWGDAIASDWVAVRVGRRLLRAWFDSRDEHMAEATGREDQWHRQQGWPLPADDVAALIEARLREQSGARFVDALFSAQPGRFRRHVFRALVLRLARAAEHQLLSKALDALPKSLFGRETARALLGLAGHAIDAEPLIRELERAASQNVLGAEKLQEDWGEESSANLLQEMFLWACEVALVAGGDRARVGALLSRFTGESARKQASLARWGARTADMAARAFAVEQALAGKPVTFDAFVVATPLPPEKDKAHAERNRLEEELRSAREIFGPILEVHAERANALLGTVAPDLALKGVESAVAKLRRTRRYQSDRYERSSRDQYLGRSLLMFAALPAVDPDHVIDAAKMCFDGESFPFRSTASDLLNQAALLPVLRPRLLLEVAGICDDVRDRKLPADEKIEVLTRYARVVLPIDGALSRRCFDAAMSVAGEVDRESLPALAVCSPLAERGGSAMDTHSRQQSAICLATVAQDAAVRVGSNEQFPWAEILGAMTSLSTPVALATCSKFNDLGHVSLDETLDTALRVALRRQELDCDVVAALAAMLEDGGHRLHRDIARSVQRSIKPAELSEQLAREALLRDKCEPAELSSLLGRQREAGEWTTALHRTADFLGAMSDKRVEPPASQPRSPYQHPRRDWNGIGDLPAFLAAIDELKESAPKDNYILADDIVNHALDSVAPVHRARYLDFMVAAASERGFGYRLGMQLRDRLRAWADTPCVKIWRRDRLLDVVKQRLPDIARYIGAGESNLPELLEISGETDSAIVSALLDGISDNIEELGSTTLFGIVGVIGSRLSPADAARVLQEHLQIRLLRLDPEDRVLAGADDLPSDTTKAAARFIGAQLGSIEAPQRWRAAHATRCLARLGQPDVIDALIDCYGRDEERTFAHPEAPFYFLNARLWLAIALARIAWESPEVIIKHRDFLFALAEADHFPHLLVRQFARLALEGLLDALPSAFSIADEDRIRRINVTRLPRRKRPNKYGHVGFDRHGPGSERERRFRFDTMDTLPYWFDGAVRGFAKPDTEDFLDRAEHWIVDRWGASDDPYKADDVRGRERFRGRDWAKSSHRHGALPTLEPYQRYLEWHAMFCAAGEFLNEYPLAKERPDEWGSFEDWLRRSGLTMPPLWLSDLRGPKPLERDLWLLPDATDQWLRGVGRADVERELGLSDPEWIVIAARHDTRRPRVSASLRVESCLVSRDNTSSLRMALEASEDSFQYRLAIGDDEDHEIEHPPFRLRSIIGDWGGDRELDRHDELRADVGLPGYRPLERVCQTLGLSRARDKRPIWSDKSGRPTVRWIAWGNRVEEDHWGASRLSSEGGRLLIKREALHALLAHEGLDLVVEVTIKRRRSEARDEGRGEKEVAETEYDRILILREDGTIDATGQRYGRWAPSRARVGARGKRGHAIALDGLSHS